MFSSIEKQVCKICDYIGKTWHEVISNPIIFIISFAFAGFIIIFLHHDKYNEPITLLMWALSCMSSGAFLGFLFGIPKTKRQQLQPYTKKEQKSDLDEISENDKRNKYSQEVNTNFEEISDWLTKIIIGVGLVEIEKIGPSLYSLAEKLGTSIQGADTSDHVMYALALIVYFFIIGFFLGYLSTRIIISKEFFKADSLILGEVNNRFDEIQTVIHRHEEISALISQADEYRLIAKTISHTTDSDSCNKADYLERSRLILEQVLGIDENIVPASISMAKYYAGLEAPNYNKAISILDKVINKEERKQKDQQSVAMSRLYYNRACYYQRKAEKEKNGKLYDDYFKLAISNLENAIELNRYYSDFVRFDDDWSKPMSENNEILRKVIGI